MKKITSLLVAAFALPTLCQADLVCKDLAHPDGGLDSLTVLIHNGQAEVRKQDRLAGASWVLGKYEVEYRAPVDPRADGGGVEVYVSQNGEFQLVVGVNGNPSRLNATMNDGQKMDNVEMSCEKTPPVAGGSVIHQYGCHISDHRVGVSYRLEVATAAVRPEFSVRSITVLQSPVAPHPIHTRFELNQVKQTAHEAVFDHTSLRVELDKQSWVAKLFLSGEEAATCTEVK